MSAVEFNTYLTTELSNTQFSSLVKNLNETFEKDFPLSFFEQHYKVTVKGYSYHCLMESGGEVVGACTAVPYEYMYNGSKLLFANPIGVFIRKDFRKDPFALYKIYSGLKELMIENGVSAAMAVLNHQSYPYFTHALKWTHIGNLPYYALPVKLGNIKKSARFLNFASWLSAHALTGIAAAKNIVSNSVSKPFPVQIVRNEPLNENHRYKAVHKKIKQRQYSLFYRTESEENIKTAYLIDFYNAAGHKDARSLNSAVRFILQNENIDLVLFIGPLNFTQYSLLKVPENKQPRALKFCGEILNSEKIGKDIFEYRNWDFGLYNLDVR